MKKHIQNLNIFLIVVGTLCWLGGLNIKAIIGGEFFESGTLNFKTGVSAEYEKALFTILANSTLLTLIAYAVVLLSSIVYLFLAKPNLKQNGWMLIGIILFFIFTPVEVYVGYFDLKIVLTYFYSTFSNECFKEILIKRVTLLSGLPAIATFCYYTIIAVFIWQPFKKPETTSPNQ